MSVDLERVGGVGVISLNAPPANAYNLEMLQELQSIIQNIRQDSDIRVVVIKSSIEKFFCAGADISMIKDTDSTGFRNFITVAGETMAMLEETPKVIIAAIAGHAMGGGLELALACDLRFGMVGDYKLGLVEINLGLNPAMGGTQRLPRLIGRSKSIRMITTGETISPELAFGWGIFDWLEDKKDFDSKVMQYAEKLAEGPTVAQGFAKQSIIKGLEMSLAEGTALERSNQQILMATDDAGEGLDAFLSKRQPKFKGS